MKRIKNVRIGSLYELEYFLGIIKIDTDKSNEAFNLLKGELTDDALNDDEFWTGEFTKNGKRYAIAGSGPMTSSGPYVMAEIISDVK